MLVATTTVIVIAITITITVSVTAITVVNAAVLQQSPLSHRSNTR